MTEIEEIRNKLRTFADERDWNQFHSPKNLVIALSVEVSEVKATNNKIEKNAQKYPAKKVRGSSKKYSDYSE